MRQAIVLVSFGVSDTRQQQICIAPLAQDIRREFPAYEVFEAYTSAMIRRRLSAQGIAVSALEELLSRLAADGYERVVLQPSHLTPGEEYDRKVRPAAAAFAGQFSCLQLGRPAFFSDGEDGGPDDYKTGLQAVLQSAAVQDGEELVLMGHGSPHRHNDVYERLQRAADEAGAPVHVGVLEAGDKPSLDDVLARLRAAGAQRVLLAPLLLVGGRHTSEDMAGEDPASWKNRLQAAGYTVRLHLHGMGEAAPFRQLYLQHLHELI